MAGKTEMENCGLMCWAMAAVAAFLAFVLLVVLGDWRVIAAIFVALVMLAALGLGFSVIFCGKLPAPAGPGTAPVAPRPGARASAAQPAPAPQPVAAPAPAAAPLAGPVAPAPRPEPEPEPKPAAKPETPPVTAEVPAPESPMPAPAEAAPVAPKLMASAPEDGGDDLKRIKGIGPKLEQLCNSLGIYRFEQIASWTEAEVAWVDSNLEGFKGRVTRDAWVAQARALAGGGGA